MTKGEFRSVADADVEGRRVLVRVDLNVPMKDRAIADATRMERILPTLELLTERGARVILLSHFGRPKGQRVPEMSLRPVAKRLNELLAGGSVSFVDDCIGPKAEKAVKDLGKGEILFLENLRFHAGEEANDPEFARRLASLGELYVDEAFSSSHRAHASIVALARALPAYAGLLMMAEITALSSALEHPERPVAAIVGGAKVSTKIEMLTNLARKFDMIIAGGGMANTFLHAQGLPVGRSLCEPDAVDTAREIMRISQASGCEIVLPLDAVVAAELAEGAASEVCNIKQIPADKMILDIGPETVASLTERLGTCRTLLWNGPLGAFEVPPFGEGTFALARAAAEATSAGNLTSVAGGGDTVAALNASGAAGGFTYVSTAGGAFLEWLEGKELPGVVALRTA